MKIAVIIWEFPSLNETFVLDHITGLIDRGHDVDIYATAPKKEPKIHQDITGYDLLSRTIYRDGQEFKPPVNWLLRALKGAPLVASGLIKNPRATLNSLNVCRLGRAASSLNAFYEVAPFLNFGKYDIVHCHFLKNGQFAAFLRELGAIRGKIVTSIHGYGPPQVAQGGIKHPFADLFKKGDLFLACSDHMKRYFALKGWGDRMIVHRCGVRVERFSVSRPKLNNGAPRLLSIGRLVEKKGFKYAIKGVAKLLRYFPKIRYEIAGDGPERPKLERLIAELHVANNVKLLGWKAREEVLSLFGEANVFVAPSVTSQAGDREGIPVVLMEAMASGLPVISTQHTGIPEVINDGQSGFLVPERDVEGLADRLTHLIKNREVCGEMGQKGRKHIEQYYNLDKQNDRLIEIYRSLSKQGLVFLALLTSLPSMIAKYLPFFGEIACVPHP